MTVAVERHAQRLVDRLDPLLVNTLTAVGFILPAGAYIWLWAQYSVNVAVSDQLADATVIRASYHNLFDWNALWAQHNENRIFFPNVLVVILARTTQFNLQVEEFLSILMLFLATALMIWTHKRRSSSTPWLYYCPVAFLMLLFTQWENTLWGFQIAWYLVLLAFASTIYLLDRRTLTWPVFIAALATAIIGSYSSVQGLLIWPICLVLLYHRRRGVAYFATWIGVAIAVSLLYFHNFNSALGAIPKESPQPGKAQGIAHIVGMVKFYVFSLGDVVGHQSTVTNPTGDPLVFLLGLAILLLAIFSIVAYGLRRDSTGASPVGVTVTMMGLLFAGMTAIGRVNWGYFGSSQSRYVTFDVLVLVGTYLTFLGRSRRLTTESSASAQNRTLTGSLMRLPDWVDYRVLRGVRATVLVLAAVIVVVSVPVGLSYAKKESTFESQAAVVTRHINTESDLQVLHYLDIFGSVPYIRHQVQILRRHHLTLFSD